MYKYIYIALLIFAVTPVVVSATYDDVSLTTDTTITIGSQNLTVHGSTAVVESIAVDSTSFTVVMPAGSSFAIKSTERKVPTVSGVTSTYITQQCGSESYTLTITVPSSGSTQTAVITPTSTTCSGASSSSSNSNTSNVSSGSSSVTPTVSSPTPTPIPPPAPTVSNPPVVLTIDLSRGSQGTDVEKLQTFLAQDKTIYPEGIVNGTFGPATERAVKKFQAKYGLSQVGRVGPATREKIKTVSAVTGTVQPAVSAPVVTPAVSAVTTVLTKLLIKGVSNDDVISLQKILNKDPETRISDTGDGSPGNETNYFGGLTLVAVQKFQVKYNIAKPGDAGYGTVGPKTRAKLNELRK